jgi:hypothetical protein
MRGSRLIENVTGRRNVGSTLRRRIKRDFPGCKITMCRMWIGFDRYSPISVPIIVSTISISREASSIVRSASGTVTKRPPVIGGIFQLV